VLILASDVEANKAAVSAVRDTGGDHYVVVRASDPVSEDELRERGADVVINPSTVIADSALQSLETGELEYMARQLAEIIEDGDGRMAILTHDNPEPDSIASATALQAIAGARVRRRGGHPLHRRRRPPGEPRVRQPPWDRPSGPLGGT